MARRISIGTLVIMLLVLGLSPVVHGQTVWTHVASACMVDEADLNDFAASNGYVYFKSGVTGSMYLRCNVVDPEDGGVSPYWNTLYVTYKDPDGTGTATQVVSRLKRASRATGTTTIIATLSSNSYAGVAVQEQGVGLSTAWNFHDYVYFVETYMYRASGSTADVRFYGVALEYLIPGIGMGDDFQKSYPSTEEETVEEE